MTFFDTIIDIFKQNFWGQLIGVLAFLVSIYNFLFCKDKKFVFVSMIASIVWGIHFHLIGLLTAAFINAIDVAKNALALKYEKSKKIAFIFVLLYLIIGFYSYDGYISIIPTFNAIAGTFLVFFVRGVWLNIGFIFLVILWGTYNFIGHSIGGFTTDITLLVTGVIGVVRILITEKNNKNVSKQNDEDLEKEIETIN